MNEQARSSSSLNRREFLRAALLSGSAGVLRCTGGVLSIEGAPGVSGRFALFAGLGRVVTGRQLGLGLDRQPGLGLRHDRWSRSLRGRPQRVRSRSPRLSSVAISKSASASSSAVAGSDSPYDLNCA